MVNQQGLALRGVLLRHLVMPGGTAESFEIMRWITRELGPETYVNLMAQYRPAGRVSSTEYPEIDRALTANEFQQAIQAFYSVGLCRRSRFSHIPPRVLVIHRQLAVLDPCPRSVSHPLFLLRDELMAASN